jgi:hypothetical protein
VAGLVSFTHWVNGFRAPQVFWRSKKNPCPCSSLAPRWVSTFMRPPAALSAAASTLPATVSTVRIAASLRASPCPPLPTCAIPAGYSP